MGLCGRERDIDIGIRADSQGEGILLWQGIQETGKHMRGS